MRKVDGTDAVIALLNKLEAQYTINADLTAIANAMAYQAEFLLARISELDWSQSLNGVSRDYAGHVEPAVSRLRSALSTYQGKSS